MKDHVHSFVVRAIFKRDLRLYFSNPSGYVFVTLFIFLSAAAAFWQRRFFLNNLANLDQLNQVFPLLLLFFIPALTMGVWSDERRQGTDELLLTLPASEIEIVLGKYLATLGVYTVSLGLSLSHVATLVWLGSPDPGLMATNYLGYWLAGGSLIAVGMVASLLTTNAAVAFILGAAFCAVPILVETVWTLFGPVLGGHLEPLSLFSHFRDFTRGVVTATGLLYFISLTAFSLYLNVLLVGRRHWPRHATGIPMALHHTIRAAALLVALIACGALASRLPIRVDATAERLHSLSSETYRLISELPIERPVIIQAFVSPDVPGPYVQARTNLLSILREIDALAGSKVEVLITEANPYTEAARYARERFGITARPLTGIGGAQTADDIFLGVALTSGAAEQVISFMDRDLSTEYEITSAIRVVAQTSRKRIGVIDTDANVLGGLDFETGRPRRPWAVVSELAKQYDLVPITPSRPVTDTVDALFLVLPSTLLQTEMDHVREAILRGMPALILVDPATSMDMRLSPAASMYARINPYRTQEPLVQKNVGDVQQLMADIGLIWRPARIVWDRYNPYPDLAHMPPEAVFIGRSSGSSEPFNPRHPATVGLQELMLPYPGFLVPADPATSHQEPLLRTGTLSGTVGYFQLVRPTPEGPVVNMSLAHVPDENEHVLATHIRPQPQGSKINAIVVADLDFIADQFFAIRATGTSNANFDNITFLLNGLDVLVGDQSLITLRERRIRHRTLEQLEVRIRAFAETRADEEQRADEDAREALAEARERLDTRIGEIQERADLSDQAKQIMARNVEEVETRRYEVLAANIESAKQAQLQASRENMEAQVRRIQSTIRMIAVGVPPVPVFLVGLFIFFRRRRVEREGAASVRRLKDTA